MEIFGSSTSIDPNKWIEDLDNININDIHTCRMCETIVVVEKTAASTIKLQMIESYEPPKLGRTFYIISLNSIYDFVENYKTRKIFVGDDLQNIINMACWEATVYLKKEESIPIDLLVKLIKLKIILIVKEDIYNHQADAVFRQHNRLFEPPPQVGGKKGKGGPAKPAKDSKQGGKSKKGGPVEDDPCAPYLSYVAPPVMPLELTKIDYKLMYIALIGFYVPEIVEYCFLNGITVRSVVEYVSKYALVTQALVSSINSDELIRNYCRVKNPSKMEMCKRKHDILHLFWAKMYDMFIYEKKPFLHDSFIMQYIPVCFVVAKKGSEQYTEQCQNFFERFSAAISQIVDFKKHHQVYLKNLTLYSLGETPKFIPIHCMDIYSKSLSNMPTDCITSEVVLEYLLDEVSYRVLDKVEMSKQALSSKSSFTVDRESITANKIVNGTKPAHIHSDFRDQLRKIFQHYKEGNFKYSRKPLKKRYEFIPALKLKPEPFVIHENNVLEVWLNYYSYISKSLYNIAVNALMKNSCVKLWEKYPALPVQSQNYSKQFGELCSALNMDYTEFCLCITMFLLSRIFCGTKKLSWNKMFNIEKYFPVRKSYLQMIPVTPEIIDECKGSTMSAYNYYETMHVDNFKWVEELPTIVMLQELAKATELYECVDHVYSPAFDSLLFRFHHNCDEFGIVTSTWKTRIRTPVGLNDFLTYVIHEDTEFIMEHDARIKEREELYEKLVDYEKRNINVITIKSEDFIIGDSIKDKCRKQAAEEQDQESGKKGKGKPSDDKSKKAKDSKTSGKKGEGKGQTINPREIIDGNPVKPNPRIEEILNAAFTHPPLYLKAFDFNGRRIEMFGSSTAFYSCDKLKVLVDRRQLLGEKPTFSLSMHINDNVLMLHRDSSKDFAFHARLNNGILAAFGRPLELNKNEPLKKLKDLYLLNETYIHTVKCLNHNVVVKRKLLVTSAYLKEMIRMAKNRTDDSTASSMSVSRNATASVNSSIPGEGSVISEKEPLKVSRKEFLKELRVLKMNTSLFTPKFKICSSKLHKYTYANRIKTNVEVKLEQLSKFMNRNRCYNFNKRVKIQKCFPIPCTKNTYANFSSYDVRFTLPNGLHVCNVPGIGPDLYYMYQFYFTKGQESADVIDELGRLFLRNGYVVVKKADGKIVMYGGNGQIVHFDVPLKQPKRRFDVKMFKEQEDEAEEIQKFVKSIYFSLHRLNKHSINDQENKIWESRQDLTRNMKKVHCGPNTTFVTQTVDLKYTLVTTEGKRVTFNKGEIVEDDSYYIIKEDILRKEQLKFQREDGTAILLSREGYVQTTYTDGTKTTTWFELDPLPIKIDLTKAFGKDSPDMGDWTYVHMYYQYEHPNYATILTGGPDNVMKVIMPQQTTFEHKEYDDYLLYMDKYTTAAINAKTITYESSKCPECQKRCICFLNIKHLYSQDEVIPDDSLLLKVTDTYNKEFIVHYDGSCQRNDDYNKCDHYCNHILHKRQNLQSYYTLNRDYSGKLIWTENMYTSRIIESQLTSQERVKLYINEDDLTPETTELRRYEKDHYNKRFLMPYLPTMIPYYKEKPFDIDTAVYIKQRLLQFIPDIRRAELLYSMLAQHEGLRPPTTLPLFGNRMKSKSDSVIMNHMDKLSQRNIHKRPHKSDRIYDDKINEWKTKCKEVMKDITEHKANQVLPYFTLKAIKDSAQTEDTSETEQVNAIVDFSDEINDDIFVLNQGNTAATSTTLLFDIKAELQKELNSKCRDNEKDLFVSQSSSECIQISSNTTLSFLSTSSSASLSSTRPHIRKSASVILASSEEIKTKTAPLQMKPTDSKGSVTELKNELVKFITTILKERNTDTATVQSKFADQGNDINDLEDLLIKEKNKNKVPDNELVSTQSLSTNMYDSVRQLFHCSQSKTKLRKSLASTRSVVDQQSLIARAVRYEEDNKLNDMPPKQFEVIHNETNVSKFSNASLRVHTSFNLSNSALSDYTITDVEGTDQLSDYLILQENKDDSKPFIRKAPDRYNPKSYLDIVMKASLEESLNQEEDSQDFKDA